MPEREPRPTDPSRPNRLVRKYVEKGAGGWEFSVLAKQLYSYGDWMRFLEFSPRDELQPPVPQFLVGFGLMHIDTLAAYHLKPNTVGLSYEITLNALYLNRPTWEILETLLHEIAHLYQETAPGLQACKHGYHNAQFVAICEDLGLHPRLGSGAHWRPADGRFERMMALFGVEKPRYAEEAPPVPSEDKKKYWWDDDRGGKKKGKSTLVLYTCESCTRKPLCKVRSGRNDLQLHCNECGGDFEAQH